MPATFAKTQREYDWVVYADNKGQHTVRRIETADVAVVPSYGAAMRLIEDLKKADAAG